MTLAINWKKFKNAFFKRFQGVKEEDLFSTLTTSNKKEMWTNTLENGKP